MLTYSENDIKATPFSKLSVFSYTNILHKHTFYEITIVLKGNAASIINNGNVRKLERGDFIVICPGDVHSIQPLTKDYLHRDFYISTNKMYKIKKLMGEKFFQETLNNKKEKYFFLNIDELGLIERKSEVFNLQSEPDESTFDLLDTMHTALVSEIFGCILNKTLSIRKNVPQWLNNLYLHLTSFHYVNLSIDEIVKNTGYSHSYVCNIFKKIYNVTLKECHTRSKILLSANMLGEEKIIDVAAAFGWENPKNYTIAFKKVFGVTPNEYKKGSTPPHQQTRPLYSDPPKMKNLSDFEKIVEP